MVPVLDAHRLYRFFHAGDEETLALQGVSLTVCRGELVAGAGPSGSGKSTLLACLAGLDEPDGGRVLVEGERLSRRPEPERAALRAGRIGVLFQSGNLLEVRANKRFSQGLMFNFSYTLGKILQTRGYREAQYDSLYRTLADYDRTHHIAFILQYDLPFGKGKRWVSGASGARRVCRQRIR